MLNLRDIIKDAQQRKVAIGHFNISDSATLKAISEAAQKLKVPIIIGTSEGEREFFDPHQIVALVKDWRVRYDFPIWLNADHTHSLEKVREAAEAGYDAILFDAGKLPLAENIKQTKEAVEIIKDINPDILVEGELGYIGSGSQILKELPSDAAVRPENFTTADDAACFVKETGIDLLAPAVGNIHGMLADSPNPKLDIERIKAIKEAAGVPLVLHGGSGIGDDDFKAAIDAGVSIIHISTELRRAWRQGLEDSLHRNKDELAPYKLLAPAVAEIKKVVYNRLKLFNQ